MPIPRCLDMIYEANRIGVIIGSLADPTAGTDTLSNSIKAIEPHQIWSGQSDDGTECQ